MSSVTDAGRRTAAPALGTFERYLTVWVALCILAGIVLGRSVPGPFQALGRMTLAEVNIPVAVLIWLMIVPMLLKVDFGAVHRVAEQWRGIAVTVGINWLVKPFSMALLGWLFIGWLFRPFLPAGQIDSYIAGLIILAAAPCTAMVFVWSNLTDGDPNFTLSQVALNDTIMVFAFAPIVALLLGLSSITVPWTTLFLSVVLYIVVPIEHLKRVLGWQPEDTEVVRRTDPRSRQFGTFIQEEICQPLDLDSLWVGIPDAVEARVATLTNMPPIPPGAPGMAPGALSPLAIPPQVGTTQEVFGRADVRRACLPGAGGIMNARSAARFFAMLAQGGALDGVRLLSEERVRWFSVPRPPCDYDYVQGVPHNGSIGGFHLVASIGDAAPPLSMAAAGRNPRTFGHPGAGGSIGWADPDTRLAVAMTHNRMFRATTPEENPFVPIGEAVRKALGVSG